MGEDGDYKEIQVILLSVEIKGNSSAVDEFI